MVAPAPDRRARRPAAGAPSRRAAPTPTGHSTPVRPGAGGQRRRPAGRRRGLVARPARRPRHAPDRAPAGWCAPCGPTPSPSPSSTRTAAATRRASCTAGGIYEAAAAAAARRLPHRGRPTRDGQGGTNTYTVDDPYRWMPTVGELDEHLIREGRHERLWEVLGAHVRRYDTPRGTVEGVSFAVWAPNARGVKVTGDFDYWQARAYPMRSLGSSGVWEIFIPGVQVGSRYRYHVLGADGTWREKSDPMAFATEVPPLNASVVTESALRVGRRRVAGRAGGRRLARAADERLRGARRLLAAGPVLPPAGRRARRLRGRGRLHPHRVHAAGRAPLRRLLGLPGHLVLRADRAVRHPGRPALPRRPRPPGRHRRHRRLGAGALPEGRLGAGPVRRHPALRARRPPARRAAGLGHVRLRLRPPRGAQLPRRQRAVLVQGVPRRRHPRRRGRLDALPRLLPRRLGAQHPRRPGEPRGGGVPAGDERDRLPRGPRRGDDRRGVDRLAGRHPADAPRRPGLRLQVEHGLDARLAGLHAASSRCTAATTTAS